jgi:hypothetical protein
MLIKKNIVFLVFLFIIINYISKKNIEKFSKKVWSCYDGINGYCYNIDRSNFNKSDWKAPEWNNTFSKKGRAITIYPNPAFRYPECETWLENPLNDEGISRSTNLEERSDGFKYFCDNKKKNKVDCNMFNFSAKGKKYVGFGNDDSKSEEERKKDFLNYCRRFGDINSEYVNKWLRPGEDDSQEIPFSNINRDDLNSNGENYVTKEITEEDCKKRLCESNNKCKYNTTNSLCDRDYDNTNAIKFKCTGKNEITSFFKDALIELSDNLKDPSKIKNSDSNNAYWNSKHWKENIVQSKFNNVIK